jgi:phosphofructokinase-like protein
MRIGVLTGGGDAPGLNAVIRAVVRYGARSGVEVVGVEDAFNGLLESPRRVRPLSPMDVRGILPRGGTILGTTNRGDPFSFPVPGGRADLSASLVQAMAEEGLDGLVVIGGDGTQRIAHRLATDLGVKVVGVPKTIDNDLSATDLTFGFQSAVDVATDALDRLHTTAEAHDRVLLLEVMGRDAGHIALAAGIAGGADIILLPEIPYDPDLVAARLEDRLRGRGFGIVVVAEGAAPVGVPGDAAAIKRAGGAANIALEAISARIEADMRVCVLGHLQRGGSPVPSDRILATRFGVAAVDLVLAGRWGEIVCLRNNEVVGAPLAEAVSAYRTVDPSGSLVRTARAVGVTFGCAGE